MLAIFNSFSPEQDGWNFADDSCCINATEMKLLYLDPNDESCFLGSNGKWVIIVSGNNLAPGLGAAQWKAVTRTNDDPVCWQIYPGPWFNIKMTSYQYRKSHCGDKTVVRSSYLHNGISYTGTMTCFYWISPQIAKTLWLDMDPTILCRIPI